MIIEQKLLLSQKPIAFIQEGGFIRVYNHSFYILVTQYNYSLNPNIKFIKKIDQHIVYGGMPARHFANRFATAIKTTFGYQLNGNFDLSEYQSWFDHLRQTYRS